MISFFRKIQTTARLVLVIFEIFSSKRSLKSSGLGVSIVGLLCTYKLWNNCDSCESYGDPAGKPGGFQSLRAYTSVKCLTTEILLLEIIFDEL